MDDWHDGRCGAVCHRSRCSACRGIDRRFPKWIPWQIIKGEQVTGISIDILKALERRIDPTLEFKPLPHKRMMVAFKSQQIAAEPSVNPLWRADQGDISVYTMPYATTCDIILVRRDSGIKGTSVDDFKGLTLGCGLGYYYPEGFQEAFARGDIIREDNATGAKNLMKLWLKRIDGAIMDNIQARYKMRRYPTCCPLFSRTASLCP